MSQDGADPAAVTGSHELSSPVTIRNEFAMVEVAIERTATGLLLRITGLSRDSSISLDALELEALCSLGPEERRRLRSPEWRMYDESAESTWPKNLE